MDPSDVLLAVTTLAASLGGYALAGINEARRDRRTARRERQSRAEDVRLRRDEARHAAQLAALMALQEDVQLMLRQCGKAMHFDHMQARAGQLTLLPEGWSEEQLATRLSLQRNASRTLDDGVRAAVEEASRITAALAADPTELKDLVGEDLEIAAAARAGRLLPHADKVNGEIGLALRRELTWEPAGA